MNKDQEILASIEINDEDLMRYAAKPNSGLAVDIQSAEEMARDPQGVLRVFQAELRRVREQRGKVLAGKLLRDIVQIIRNLDATMDSADKGRISEHVVTSLADTDIEVLRWVLTQDLSDEFANALSARILERVDGQKSEGLPAQPNRMPPMAKPEDAVHEVGKMASISEAQEEPESPVEEGQVRKEKKLSAAEMEEKAKRFAHLKAGLSAIMHGKREVFQDKQVMQALPGTVRQLYSKQRFGTAKQIISRLAAGLSIEDSAVRGAVSESLSRSLDTVPPELKVHTTRELQGYLINWIKFETSPSRAYERISVQLEKLAKLLLGQREYDECISILETFTATYTGRRQTHAALTVTAKRLLTNVCTPEIIELLVRDFRTAEENKGKQAERCLSMLGSAPVDRLLDIVLESEDRSERLRVLRLISEIGRLALPAVTKRIVCGGPWYFMRNLALLLGRVGHEDHVWLLRQLLDHSDVRVRQEALDAMCHIGGECRGEILLSYLPLADDEFKTKIVAVLGALRCREAVQPLLELLESRPALLTDERNELEERICIALGRIESEEAIPALSSIVGQKQFWSIKPFHKNVRAAAQKALEQIRAKQHKKDAA